MYKCFGSQMLCHRIRDPASYFAGLQSEFLALAYRCEVLGRYTKGRKYSEEARLVISQVLETQSAAWTVKGGGFLDFLTVIELPTPPKL